uniref:Telomeric repeat-binding factor 2-interacting protein 1 n=2 Tax=Hymenolepis diminuta TaxID=6216 RepID=A0A0R3STG9_HYMDI
LWLISCVWFLILKIGSRTLRLEQSNRPGVRLCRRNLPITHRQRSSSKSHSSHSAFSAGQVSTESSLPSSPQSKTLPEKSTPSNRHRYTDAEDYAILDYIITQKLIKKVRSASTWSALETAGIFPHSANSMQFRFLNNIIYHFSEVLHCTSEGRAKYSDPATVKKLYSELLASSQNPKRKPANSPPLALSDLSCYTSDESPHDSKIKPKSSSSKGKSKSVSPQKSPLEELPIKLVDYEDTQSNQTPPKDIPKTPVKCGEPFMSQRLSLSSPSGRRKSLRPRRLLFGYRDHSDDDVMLIKGSPSRSSPGKQQQTIRKPRASTRSQHTQLSQSRETSSQKGGEEDDEEFFSIDSDTSRRRKRRRVSFESGQVDLDARKELSTSKCASVERVNAIKDVNMIPDTFPEATLNSSLLISGSRKQLRSLQQVSNASDGDSVKFPLMDAQPRVSNEILLSRTVDFTRKLDSFARHHQLTSTDAALLLHASSGDFEVASKYLETSGGHPLWFPRDDSHLLSTSVSDIRTLISKFGQTEVSRRLVYLTDQSLFS